MALSEPGPGLVKLEYRIEVPDIVARRQDAELSLGMFLNIVRECCGSRWAPEEVHFEHPKPEAWREHESAFDAPVYFSQVTNALIFKRDCFVKPMPAPDLKLLSIARMCLHSMGAASLTRPSVLARIKTTVRSKLAEGYPTLEAVADKLQLAPSALSARAFPRGPFLQGIWSRTSARTWRSSYLKSRELPLSEIALLLGYSELSAFSRAFSRWTGASPRSYRASRDLG